VLCLCVQADWAFNYERRGDFCKKLWGSIPDDIDILMTHGPPAHIGDLTVRGERAGCPELLRWGEGGESTMRVSGGHSWLGHGLGAWDLRGRVLCVVP
jgi:hypothetical protein